MKKLATWALVALPLSACKGCQEPIPVDTGRPDNPETWVLDPWGPAPWDPVEAHGSEQGRQAPVLEDQDGAEVGLTELTAPEGSSYGWAPAADLDPGSYTLRPPDGSAAQLVHGVDPYGVSTGFDLASLEGRTWLLDEESLRFGVPLGVEGILLSLSEGLWLTVEEVEGDEALLSIVVADSSEEPCLVLRLRALHDGQGQLWWEQDDLEANTAPTPTQLTNLWLHLGALPTGDKLGGAEGGLTVETTAIDEAFADPDTGTWIADTCELVAGFGGSCYDCAGLGDTCTDFVFHAGVLDEVSPSWSLEELPSCGADLSDLDVDIEFPSFDFDCTFPDLSCATVSFGFMGLLGWRRRRRRD